MNNSATLFEVMTGTVMFLAFLTVGFCIASLRAHMDENKLRQEENLKVVMHSILPPEHLLTPTGLRRVKIAKAATFVLVATTAIIVLKVQILAP